MGTNRKRFAKLTDGQIRGDTTTSPTGKSAEALTMTMTREEEWSMLDATAKVIRHEIAGLPTNPETEREAEMIRVAGEIFCTFIDGRAAKLRWELDNKQDGTENHA